MSKIHVLALKTGYVEDNSLSTFFFSHPEGFDTVYDAVKDLIQAFCKRYKEIRHQDKKFWCNLMTKGNKEVCPMDKDYDKSFCWACGKPKPEIDMTLNDFVLELEQELLGATNNSWEFSLEEVGSQWWEYLGLNEILKNYKPENIAYFREDPFLAFSLTLKPGKEFGKKFNNTLEIHKNSPNVEKFLKFSTTYNKNAEKLTKEKMIETFEEFRLG